MYIPHKLGAKATNTHNKDNITIGKRISKVSGEARQWKKEKKENCIFVFGDAVLVLAIEFKQELGLYCLVGACANSANVSTYAYHW